MGGVRVGVGYGHDFSNPGDADADANNKIYSHSDTNAAVLVVPLLPPHAPQADVATLVVPLLPPHAHAHSNSAQGNSIECFSG